MSPGRFALSFSDADLARLQQVDRLLESGEAAVPALVARLDEPSWAVRRAVIAALVTLGDAALGPLCEVLQSQRGDEARLAAAVDALSASPGDVDGVILRLLERRADLSAALLCDLAQILGRRKSARAVPVLTALVGHEDDNVAVAAIEALGRIGGAGAVEPLIAAVAGGRFFRVFPAIELLGRSGDPRAVAALRALLDDPLYALEALRALGVAGEDTALAGALTRPEDDHVRAAATALADLHARRLERIGVDQATPAAARAAVLGASLVPRLHGLLTGADASERRALCRLLGWAGGEAAADALLELLDQGLHTADATAALADLGAAAQPRLRRAVREGSAARRLLLLPLLHANAEAGPELRLCFGDPEPAVRALAASASGASGDPSFVPALFELLTEPDPAVVQAASGAIQSLGSGETEALALAAARSPELRVRRAALRILAYFGYPSALEPFLAAMRDPDTRLRDLAIQGLPFVEDPRSLDALLDVTAHPSPPARAAGMRALGHTGRAEPRVLACLLCGIADPDAWVRYYACQAVAKLGGDIPLDPIVALLDDDAGQVRVAAVEALARLGTERAVGALHRAAASTDPDLARAALLGLGSLQRRDALPLIEAALRSPDRATRLVALGAASALQAPEVIDLLREAAAADEDHDVRRAALGHLAARPGLAGTHALASLLGTPLAREDAALALTHPHEGRRAALLTALESADDDIAPILVSVLARGAEPVPALEAVLVSSAPAGRRAAVAALAALTAPRSRAVLERALAHDPDPEVQKLAAVALGR